MYSFKLHEKNQLLCLKIIVLYNCYIRMQETKHAVLKIQINSQLKKQLGRFRKRLIKNYGRSLYKKICNKTCETQN